MRNVLRTTALVPVVAVTALLAACGAGGSGRGPAEQGQPGEIPAAAKDDALAALVPANIRADGLLVFGQDQSSPPGEFVENGKPAGFDVDLGTAVGQVLGLGTEFRNTAFDGIIPGIAAGKYEIGMSSFNVKAERLKTVDMVTYYRAGKALAVPKGNPDRITLDTLCGKNVATQKGTAEVEDLERRSAACVSSGKPAVTITQFQAQTDVNLALASKRVQAELADSPTIDYVVKQNGGLERVGEPYDTAPYGMVLPKDSGDFGRAVQGAVQKLIDSGICRRIIDKWGLAASGVLTRSEINPPV
ncbi:ABC transporter substrate-binding protein [Amycolatopsis sp. NPDC059021]|uniref:ABC transporter substrate-binding protein n=1 Tax=Amycolatopsis sp. NPDC059021 TaxID=3346704 RepID=UPI00366DFBB4